ncbi:hypothetical protein P3T25_009888 [Paraburkholderia sp. GAS32]
MGNNPSTSPQAACDPQGPSTRCSFNDGFQGTADLRPIVPFGELSAIPDIQVPPSMRRLQVAFPTFASRQPRMSAITSSGCVLVLSPLARSSRLLSRDCNDRFHDTTVARVLELIVASLAFAVFNFRRLEVFLQVTAFVTKRHSVPRGLGPTWEYHALPTGEAGRGMRLFFHKDPIRLMSD